MPSLALDPPLSMPMHSRSLSRNSFAVGNVREAYAHTSQDISPVPGRGWAHSSAHSTTASTSSTTAIRSSSFPVQQVAHSDTMLQLPTHAVHHSASSIGSIDPAGTTHSTLGMNPSHSSSSSDTLPPFLYMSRMTSSFSVPHMHRYEGNAEAWKQEQARMRQISREREKLAEHTTHMNRSDESHT